MVRDELAAETHSQVGREFVAHAWARIVLTNAVRRAALEGFVAKARDAGLLRTAPDLSRLLVLIGLLADTLLFAPSERFLHRRWGTGVRAG